MFNNSLTIPYCGMLKSIDHQSVIRKLDLKLTIIQLQNKVMINTIIQEATTFLVKHLLSKTNQNVVHVTTSHHCPFHL